MSVTAFHQQQIIGYLRYIRLKREALATDLQSKFNDQKSRCGRATLALVQGLSSRPFSCSFMT